MLERIRYWWCKLVWKFGYKRCFLCKRAAWTTGNAPLFWVCPECEEKVPLGKPIFMPVVTRKEEKIGV